jgi:SAM-dependent methyltransferase
MPSNPCRLCGHARLQCAFSIKNAPRNVQRLLRHEELKADRAVDLPVLTCEQCGFVQIEPLLEQTYYDDYLMTATHSSQMQEHQGRQARDFVKGHGLAGRSIIEVGCGDGSFLEHLRSAGALALGVEPSARYRELAIARGFEVEGGYVTETRTLASAPCDAFVTRQVLEHVPEIHGFLTGIRRNLKPGAVGLVEVPSLEKALADRRYYDFFADHVNYFSLRTLRLALELNGFEVLATHHEMFDEYLVAIVRNSAHPSLADIGRAIDSLGAELRAFIAAYHARGEKVAMWGAGGKGLSVLAAAGIRDIDLLVDSDPYKQGLFTPVSHLEVRSPSVLRHAKASCVIITAMAYRMEIERTLAEELDFQGDVAILGHTLQLVARSRGT